MVEYKSSLLTIRFSGPDFYSSGIGIYDLGTSLICLQRLMNKAYLSRLNRLHKGAIATRTERQEIALQLGSREKASDGYGLVPYLSSSISIEAIEYCAALVFETLFTYAAGKMLDKLLSEKSESKKNAMCSMYSEVSAIAGRIDDHGVIQSIEIAIPHLNPNNVARINVETRDHILQLQNEHFLGKPTHLTGAVYKMYPNILMVSIHKKPSGKCNIFLSEKDFRRIRYDKKNERLIQFTGRPRHRLGITTPDFSEFEAYSIKLN